MAAVAAGVAVTLLLTACGGDDEAGGGTSTTTATPASETTAAPATTLGQLAQAEADVRAAYDAYWQMSERLAAAPDPEDPEIAELTTGTAREAMTTLLTQFLAEGRIVEFREDSGYEMLTVELEGTTAEVRGCHVDHAATLDAETRAEIRESTATFLLEARLVQVEHAWRVDQIRDLDAWEGVAVCE